MKKAVLLCLTACTIFVGCGINDTDSIPAGTESTVQEENSTPEETDAQEEIKGYIFESNGVDVVIDAEAAPIIDALGEPLSYFEAQSCAFQGMDKMYTYVGFEINTYEEDGVDYISSVRLKDDTVQTQEGVCLFMTMEDMTAAYGEDYADEKGMYVYEKDGMKLKFIIFDNEITSIEYASMFLD